MEKREKVGGYPLTKIYVNSVEHRMIFKISKQLSRAVNSWNDEITWKYLIKITKDENGENVSPLEVTEAVLIHCNFVRNNYQHDSRVLYTFNPNKCSVQLEISCLKILFFIKPLIQSFHILKYVLLTIILNHWR